MKNKLYRISALLMAFCLMLQIVSFAQTNEDYDAVGITPEIDALSAMQLLTDDFIALPETDSVSRALFLGNMFRVAGFSYSTSAQGNNPFVDVTDDTPYKDEIITFYEMGYVNGTGYDTFSPDTAITYGQAIKISLDVLGYTEYVKAKYDGSIDGYIFTASRLDLTDGMRISNYNAPATVRDVAVLLYNAGITPIFEVNAISKGDTGLMQNYDTGKILFSNRDIYYKEGIVQSNGLVSTDGVANDSEFAVIGSKRYKLNNLDITSLLGYNVRYFYNENDGVPVLLWAYPTDNNEVLVIDSEDLSIDDSAYSRECIVYNTAKKREIANIDKYATVIYNNTLYNGFTVEQLKPRSGTIRLIDINRDKKYDTVIIEEFSNMFVTAVAANESFVADKFGNSLYFEDYENVKIIKNGKSISVKEIPLNVIVSYVESLDRKHLYLYVNGDGLVDTLDSVSTDSDETILFFTNADREYRFSHSYMNLGSNYTTISPKPGVQYKYYLDKDGEIAHIEEADKERIQYVYLLDCAPDDSPLRRKGKAEFRVLLSDGTKATVKSKDKLILNGTKGCTGTDILDYISNNSVTLPVVVKAAFDADSDIKEIEFAEPVSNPYGYDKNNFTLDYESVGSSFGKNTYYMFEKKYNVTTNTICFVTYTNTTIDEPYDVVQYSTINNSTYPVKIYDCDQNFEPAAISIERSVSAITLDGVILVDKVRTVCNADGEWVKQIEGVNRGSRVRYSEIEPGYIPDDLQRGDVVRVSLFKDNITKLNVLTKLNEKPEPFISGTLGKEVCFIYGPLYSRSSSSIVTMNAPEHPNGLLTSTSTNNNAYFYVSVYDYNNDEVYVGNPNDVYPLNQPDSNGDFVESSRNVSVLIYRRYNYVQEVIVVYY